VAACLLPSALSAQATPMNPVDIKEWQVPWGADTRPRDPFADASGRVWFVGQAGNYIAYLVPETGEFKRYTIEEGTHPHNLIVDDRGVWYAGNRNARIGRIDPASGDITTYMMPDPAARDPHTLVFDRQKDIWFTVQGGNFVGHLATKSGDVHLIKSPVEGSRPYGIVINSQDRPWIVLFGTNKLATVDAGSMTLRTIDLPRAEARPRRLEVAPDDRIYYVDYAAGMFGRYDPKTNQFKEWPSPSGARARGYAMATDDKGRIWFVESGVQPNKFVGFDPATEKFFSITDVPSGGGTVRHMMFHAPTRAIWFGTDTGTIGRVIVP
jgi:virginiamycin B lyase